MTEPACRNCRRPKSEHDATNEEYFCPDQWSPTYEPGPTYAQLEERIVELEAALAALVNATDWTAIGDLHDGVESHVVDRVEEARRVLALVS